MTLPPPPYTVKSVDSPVEQDQHANNSAFITLTNGQSCLLRLKGPFPIEGDVIADRVLVEKVGRSGKPYLKLEKPQRNGVGGSESCRAGASSEGPGEAYWAGQNAAKGRAHAQEMALRTLAIYNEATPPANPERIKELLVGWSDFFQKDAEQARDRAVEKASGPAAPTSHDSGAAPPPNGSGAPAPAPSEQPTGAVTSSDSSPTQKQTEFMIVLAKKRGLDGPAMKAVLKTRLGVEQFSHLRKADCVDKWKAAIAEPFLEENPTPDVPVEAWPPTDLPAPADDSSDLPF